MNHSTLFVVSFNRSRSSYGVYLDGPTSWMNGQFGISEGAQSCSNLEPLAIHKSKFLFLFSQGPLYDNVVNTT